MNLFAYLRAWLNRKPGLQEMPRMPRHECAKTQDILAKASWQELDAWLDSVYTELREQP